MNNHGFFTVLFMFIAGIILLIIAISPFAYIIYNKVNDIYIKKKGELVDAIISYKSLEEEDKTTYKIEYIVNEKRYEYYFKDNPTKYYQGETIKVYCIENSPKKVWVEGEKDDLLTILKSYYGVTFVFGFLGYLCIKEYNIFKYKRIIEVE